MSTTPPDGSPPDNAGSNGTAPDNPPPNSTAPENAGSNSTAPNRTASPNAAPQSAGAQHKPGSWGELFSAPYRLAVIVLAGGVLLYAMNVYLTAALLPSAVADLGDQQLYAWVLTVFLLASVIASLFVSRLIADVGPRTAYLIGFGLFGLGSLISAVAPTMPIMLGGRAIQGLGGGLLAGLGFAVIRRAVPEHLITRSLGVSSAMWGVGNLVGPSIGGLFAQLGWWRWAMALLVLLAIGLGWMAAKRMPGHQRGEKGPAIPGLALLLVSAAATAISIAGVIDGVWVGILLAAGVLMLVAFVLRERTATVRVLPGITYQRGNPLKWVYLSLAILAVVSTSEGFIPLFGQELGGLGPLLAGFLGAALSWGWTIGALGTSGLITERAQGRARLIGPIVLGLGIAGYAALQLHDPSWWVIGGWALALVVAGCGIGVAFQQGAASAIKATDDAAEATRAATGVSTVQLMSNALGTAVAGVLVARGGDDVLASARLLLWPFAALALAGALTAWAANRSIAKLTGSKRHPAEPALAGDRA
ncbi:MFS transporter [Nakamurella aerolata]|uniref:MFS transporter n=1 Tax=Nakamurella aerolata TaxID=1656892 RepID=A0A849A6R4_9ACTN|nr:MFS transporter [Nakamurella aerolata]NNG35727.1 MFS transporter [Nakamurella aerolata]